jgi:hypothetical protein
MLHKKEQRFLGWIENKLGAHRVEDALLADVMIWQYGLCFSHGGIVINRKEVVHAFGPARMCLPARISSTKLDLATVRGREVKRPRLIFDVWGR